jgi:hypothetical protein
VQDDGFQLDESGDLVTGSYTCNSVAMSDPVDSNHNNVFSAVNAANSVGGFATCAAAQAAFTAAAGVPAGATYCDSLDHCSSPSYKDVNGIQVTFATQQLTDGNGNPTWTFINPVCNSKVPVTWTWNNPGPYPGTFPNCNTAAANLATVNVCYQT